MFDFITQALIRRAMRTPYFHLINEHTGEYYMRRFWLVPYNLTDKHGCYRAKWYRQPIVWLLQKFDIAIRVHHIIRPDVDRHMHDHPWSFLSLVLDGFYVERRPAITAPCFEGDTEAFTQRRRDKGTWAFRRASDRHNVSLVSAGGVWTLFITFRKEQPWGFYTPKGKIYYQEYERQGTDAAPMAVYSEKTRKYEVVK